MATMSDEKRHDRNQPSSWQRSTQMALGTAVLIVGFYLLREHWGHVLGLWSYLLLLTCPLMHLMHGHGGHRHGPHAGHRTHSGHSATEK
jgi:Protein of unknown function (DUF2933)